LGCRASILAFWGKVRRGRCSSFGTNKGFAEIGNQWIFCEGVAGVFGREGWYESLGEPGARGVVFEGVGEVSAEYQGFEPLRSFTPGAGSWNSHNGGHAPQRQYGHVEFGHIVILPQVPEVLDAIVVL
jgi:hypothetical protein